MVTDPYEIEKKSFELISRELGKDKINPEYEDIVKRVIHTTADFEYAGILEFHPDAVTSAVNSLKTGTGIYVDTKMIEAGINKKVLKKLGCRLHTYIDTEDVAKEAKEKGITRSIVSINIAFSESDAGIYVIGNAPTALFRLKDLINLTGRKPAVIIGVPVGFVGAAESKEEIKKTGVPYIITNGRKGGSTVAAAIMNSLLYRISR